MDGHLADTCHPHAGVVLYLGRIRDEADFLYVCASGSSCGAKRRRRSEPDRLHCRGRQVGCGRHIHRGKTYIRYGIQGFRTPDTDVIRICNHLHGRRPLHRRPVALHVSDYDLVPGYAGIDVVYAFKRLCVCTHGRPVVVGEIRLVGRVEDDVYVGVPFRTC